MSFWNMVMENERQLDLIMEGIGVSTENEYANSIELPLRGPNQTGVQNSEHINIEATGNGWIVNIFKTHCTQGKYHADKQLFLDANELLEFVSFEVSQHYLEKSSEK